MKTLLSLMFVFASIFMTSCEKTITNTVIINAIADIQGNWSGTNNHTYQGNYEGEYYVNVVIADSTFTINYIGADIPIDRNNPNVWIYKPKFVSTQFNLQVSSTYAIQVTFIDKNNITLASNNGDELFNLKRQ